MPSAARALRIAVFTKNLVNPAYAAARTGAERAAARMGASVKHYVPQVPDDPAQQAALLQEALDESPDAVVIAPVHRTKIDAALNRIMEAGIPVIGFISHLEAEPWVAFVGSDDRRLGAALATTVFGRLEGKGRVVLVHGSPDSQTSIDRSAGFGDAVAQFPRIDVVASCDGRYDFETARVAVAAVLNRTPDVDAIVAANDMMALGAVEALKAAGRSALVAGVNAVPAAVKAVREGVMAATADYSAMNLAAIAVECALRHLRGEKVPRHLTLPVVIVDRNNAALWDVPFEARPMASWEGVIRPGADRF